MPEHDLTDRLTEQLGPIIETLQRRIQTELTDRDKAAIAHALGDATITGARVMWAWVVANAAEAAIELPASVVPRGLRSQDFWAFDD